MSTQTMAETTTTTTTAAANRRTHIRIGTRKSKLAMIQTHWVVNQLRQLYATDADDGGYEFTIKSMTTTGDNVLDRPLAKIGEKALFTRELEDDLLAENIDLIVHSLKDLPTTLPDGCAIAVITKRENSSDAIVLKSGLNLDNPFDILSPNCHQINENVTIGTSSLRRIAQLKHLNPDIRVVDIRGNLNTRLSKLDDPTSGYSALILASAGLIRADYGHRISGQLLDNWYYAVGQGALAIETRTDDQFIMDLLKPLIHLKTTCECLAERTFMQQLEGGCSIPIGVRSVWTTGADDNDANCVLTLEGVVMSLDGRSRVDGKVSRNLNRKLDNKLPDLTTIDRSVCPFNYTGIAVGQFTEAATAANQLANSAMIGYDLAQDLLGLGAKDILDDIKLNSN